MMRFWVVPVPDTAWSFVESYSAQIEQGLAPDASSDFAMIASAARAQYTDAPVGFYPRFTAFCSLVRLVPFLFRSFGPSNNAI